jgi:hypothetical protein
MKSVNPFDVLHTNNKCHVRIFQKWKRFAKIKKKSCEKNISIFFLLFSWALFFQKEKMIGEKVFQEWNDAFEKMETANIRYLEDMQMSQVWDLEKFDRSKLSDLDTKRFEAMATDVRYRTKDILDMRHEIEYFSKLLKMK